MLSKRKQDLVFTYMVEDWARQNNFTDRKNVFVVVQKKYNSI